MRTTTPMPWRAPRDIKGKVLSGSGTGTSRRLVEGHDPNAAPVASPPPLAARAVPFPVPGRILNERHRRLDPALARFPRGRPSHPPRCRAKSTPTSTAARVSRVARAACLRRTSDRPGAAGGPAVGTEGKDAHSLHAYFMRAGDENLPDHLPCRPRLRGQELRDAPGRSRCRTASRSSTWPPRSKTAERRAAPSGSRCPPTSRRPKT